MHSGTTDSFFKDYKGEKDKSRCILYCCPIPHTLIWLKTFILWVLAFGTLAAIAFESIKGQIGLMIAVIFILIGLI